MTASRSDGSSPRCEVRVDREGEATRISVAGDLDWTGVTGLLTAVSESGADQALLLDLTRVSKIDLGGSEALITTILSRARTQSDLTLLAAGPLGEILDHIGISGVARVIRPEEGRTDASLAGGDRAGEKPVSPRISRPSRPDC